MQVKAIYEDGIISFTQPLRFKHSKFEVVVNIPQEECVTVSENAMASTTPLAATAARDDTYIPIGRRLDNILGPYRGKLGNVTPQEIKEIRHEHSEKKYFGNK